jgi:hypothetical protein
MKKLLTLFVMALVFNTVTFAAPIISGPATPCIGTSGNLYSTDAGHTTYVWTVTSGGSIDAGQGTDQISVTWNTAGSQTVSVVIDGTINLNYPVTVEPLPSPSVNGSNLVCNASTGNVYTTETGMSGYLWNVSGGTITAGAGTSSITVTWNTPGIQMVTVNYTTPFGCTAASPGSEFIIVLDLPTPVITGPNDVCAGSTGKVYSTDAGMTGYTWAVSAGGIITSGSGTNSITVNWNTAGTQTVSVSYTNVFGCTAASPSVYTVTVNAQPIPVITGPGSVCINSTGNVYSTASSMTNYIWSISAGGTITAGGGTGNNTVTVTWNTSGAQTVSVSYTNAFGCTTITPTVYPVTVNALPVPTITGPTAICSVPNPGNVYSTEAGMSGYTWSVSAGGSITAGSGTDAITVTWNTLGAQTVSVNYTNGNGCTASAPTVKNITVSVRPVPTISGPTPVCAGATGNIYTTESGMSGYTWSVSAGGTITAGGGSGSNTVTVTWNATGAQTVSVNYTNTNGCTASSPTVYTVTVNVRPVPTITGPATICGVPNAGNVYSTESGMSGYTWAVSSGGTITSGSGTYSISVNWTATGSQTVSVNYSDANGCTASSPTVKSVSVNSRPVPTITGPGSVCGIPSAGNVYFTESSMSGYTWAVSAGGSVTAGSGTNSITVTWSTAGAKTVTVNYTDGNGCTAVSPTVKNVNVYVLPVPTITGPGSVCGRESLYHGSGHVKLFMDRFCRRIDHCRWYNQ